MRSTEPRGQLYGLAHDQGYQWITEDGPVPTLCIVFYLVFTVAV